MNWAIMSPLFDGGAGAVGAGVSEFGVDLYDVDWRVSDLDRERADSLFGIYFEIKYRALLEEGHDGAGGASHVLGDFF